MLSSLSWSATAATAYTPEHTAPLAIRSQAALP